MSKPNIKKITEDKASQYFSIEEDLIDSPIRFYTKTQDEDGWDKITYYTSRRKDIYSNRGEADQWVYILSNPCLLYTSPSPRDRQKSRMPSSA